MNSAPLRLFLVAIGGLLLITGCTSGEDSTDPTTTTSSAADDATTTTIDNRTDEEIAIDRLDLMMFDLGVTDLEGRSNCVVARLESENIEVTGEGTSELIALFGCDDNAISQWLPMTNPALPSETWQCTVASINDWINELTIVDAEAFFEAAEPPMEFIEVTATRCGVSADDLLAAF